LTPRQADDNVCERRGTMRTVTVSVQLPESEAARLDRAAREMGVDRSTFLTLAVRRGAQALMLERVCGAYRNQEVTLSRAAEMAGLSARAMILEVQRHGMELNYPVNELAQDLQPLRSPSDPSGRALSLEGCDCC